MANNTSKKKNTLLIFDKSNNLTLAALGYPIIVDLGLVEKHLANDLKLTVILHFKGMSNTETLLFRRLHIKYSEILTLVGIEDNVNTENNKKIIRLISSLKPLKKVLKAGYTPEQLKFIVELHKKRADLVISIDDSSDHTPPLLFIKKNHLSWLNRFKPKQFRTLIPVLGFIPLLTFTLWFFNQSLISDTQASTSTHETDKTEAVIDAAAFQLATHRHPLHTIHDYAATQNKALTTFGTCQKILSVANQRNSTAEQLETAIITYESTVQIINEIEVSQAFNYAQTHPSLPEAQNLTLLIQKAVDCNSTFETAYNQAKGRLIERRAKAQLQAQQHAKQKLRAQIQAKEKLRAKVDADEKAKAKASTATQC